MKISPPSKKKSSLPIIVRGSAHSGGIGARGRQRADSLSVKPLESGPTNDQSVTVENQIVRRALEEKVRTLIDERNVIIDAPNFADNLKLKDGIVDKKEDENLTAIDKNLALLEHHLNGQAQVKQRVGRTRELCAKLDQDFADIQKIIKGYHDCAH